MVPHILRCYLIICLINSLNNFAFSSVKIFAAEIDSKKIYFYFLDKQFSFNRWRIKYKLRLALETQLAV